MLQKFKNAGHFTRFGSAIIFAIFLIAATGATTNNKTHKTNDMKPVVLNQLPIEAVFPSFSGATGWLNSKPLTAKELKGKVVLIEFWTFTCINWMRTNPYARAWAEKYKAQGLIVIGVHTPEFSFEKDIDNIRRSVKDRNINYPVAIDNNYGVWNAFKNQYWPAFYFIDARGNIRHHQFGEGNYEQSEKVIQQLLTEAGSVGLNNELVSLETDGDEADADWSNLQSPENYLGYPRTNDFASPGNLKINKGHEYILPKRLKLNEWALSGEWTAGKEAVMLNSSNGRIVYQFHARDVNLVMGPTVPGTSTRFRISIDGQPPEFAQGKDIDNKGFGIVSEQRMYQLIRQTSPIIDRKFEIEFLDPGVEAFAFTFG
ncbi:MAG: thioredoxin family protein [Ferruginibacter sp.]|nr:thioredoxin family protein [Ferruginibacter sp.]